MSALLEVPGVNAMIDDVHQEIVYREYVDMSVAVSMPKGLVTPVHRGPSRIHRIHRCYDRANN